MTTYARRGRRAARGPSALGLAGEAVQHSRHVLGAPPEIGQADVLVEGVWSLLKRSIVGSYHHLSVRHLPAYLDEISFRFNNRDNSYLFRDMLLKLIGAESLPYVRLTADS